jgi:hypothetical protein
VDGGVSALILFLTIMTVLAMGIMAAYALVVGLFTILARVSQPGSAMASAPVLLPPQSHAIGD